MKTSQMNSGVYFTILFSAEAFLKLKEGKGGWCYF
jgi:hypothetical protein